MIVQADLIKHYKTSRQIINELSAKGDARCAVSKTGQFFTSIIAGGYLRDSFYNRAHKDVDVFTNAQYPYDLADLGRSSYENARFRYIGDISVNRDGTTYNIVYLDEEADVLNTKQLIMGFDLNICQIGFDGDALEMTADFLKGVSNKEIEVIHDTAGYKNHAKRVHAKYPNFTFRDPYTEMEL